MEVAEGKEMTGKENRERNIEEEEKQDIGTRN